MEEAEQSNPVLISIPQLLINKNTGNPVAIEIVEGKLTDYNKSALKNAGLSISLYKWLRKVARQMKLCRRKSAPSEWGAVYLIDDSFEEKPYYPLEVCDVRLAGMLGIDVMYVTRIQKERM